MSNKKSSGGLKYFSEDSTGLKVQPKTVLIMSLVYIGLVVLLHIYSKMTAVTPKPQTPENPQSTQQAKAGPQGEPYTEETL